MTTRRRLVRSVLTLLALALPAGPAGAGGLPPGVAGRLDPRLLPAALAAATEPVSVWVGFADKGETGPADLVRRLADAAAALDPHARERRRRAGVTPLVDYLDLPVHEPYLEALRAQGLAPYGVSRWLNRAAVRAAGAQLAVLAALPGVADIRPVERAERMGRPPAGPAGAGTPVAAAATGAVDYGLTLTQVAQIGVPALHDSGYTGAGVRICVLDDGFNRFATHAALRDADVLAARDFVRGTDDPTDPAATAGFRHGTETFGCIAGALPGRYLGTAPGATFLLGRTEDSAGETRVEMVYWAMGAEWADSAGADIISSSVGYMTFDPPEASYIYADMDGRTTVVSRAAQIAAAKGILLVNSAGNEGNRPWRYIVAPADVHGDSLIAAAAVDAAGAVASFSSYGPSADGRVKPDLAAMGVSTWVVSPSSDTSYTRLSGTSFSCPLLAGLAACVMQARPAWPPRLVIRALRASASRADDPDDRVGYGIPDGGAVLAWEPDTLPVPGLPPLALGLRLAGPNPLTVAAPVTRVAFGVGAGLGAPRLRVLDALGRRVAGGLAFARDPSAGAGDLPFVATWDGRDDSGRLLPAGLYFITLEAGGRRASVRVVSLR